MPITTREEYERVIMDIVVSEALRKSCEREEENAARRKTKLEYTKRYKMIRNQSEECWRDRPAHKYKMTKHERKRCWQWLTKPQESAKLYHASQHRLELELLWWELYNLGLDYGEEFNYWPLLRLVSTTSNADSFYRLDKLLELDDVWHWLARIKQGASDIRIVYAVHKASWGYVHAALV